MSRILYATRADSIPGSTLRKLTRAATDDTGRRWPAGTLFQPLSFGANGAGRDYQTITVLGQRTERVTFTRAAAS